MDRSLKPPGFLTIAAYASLAAAVFVTALGSILLTRDFTEIAAVWPVNAIVLAAILRREKAHWPLILAVAYVANCAANIVAGNGWIIGVFCSAANIAEILICAWVLSSKAPSENYLDQGWTFFARLWSGSLVGSICSAAIATAAITFHNAVDPSALFLSWLIADGLGLVIFTPCFLALQRRDLALNLRGQRTPANAALLWSGFVAVTLLVFGQRTVDLLPLGPFLIVPVAFGLGSAAVAVGVGLMAVISIIATALGFGPVATVGTTPTAHLHYLQLLLALTALAATPAGMAIAQRQRALQQLKDAHEALGRSEQEFEAIAQSMRDMIVRFTPDTTMTFVSPASRIVIGYEPEELIGRRTRDFIHPDDAARAVDELRRAGKASESGPGVNIRLRARHKDGTWRWIEGRPRAVIDPQTKEPATFYDVMRDVTAQVEMEQSLAAALEGAKAAVQAKSTFLSNMSHELRTPLNSVIGYSRLLAQSDELNARDRRFAQQVEVASQATLSIVNDVLDAAALERGVLTLRPAPFSVHDLLNDIASMIGAQAESKKLAVYVNADPGLAELHGDRDRLVQILLNLASNATKFTDAGSVSITATLLADLPDRQSIRFDVTDTGRGIAPEHRETIFDRFVQLGQNSAEAGAGGLGLAIAKEIATLMHGSISVESELGRGSNFRFHLTLQKSASRRLASEAQRLSIEPLRILVVDDVDLNRELLVHILEPDGHSVETASTGAEAVAKCATEKFDAILMDVRMPNMDGVQATYAIRAGGASAATPIIALTAGVLPDKMARCMAAGMNALLAKPVVEADLLQALADWTRATSRTDKAVWPDDGPLSALRQSFATRLVVERAVLANVAAAEEISALVHRMAGSAGSFGFELVGRLACELDEAILRTAPDWRDKLAILCEAIDAELRHIAA